ncbi:MAG: FMN-binding negative transcriptional regulator [Rhodospirillaceae bacterium]|nr:FMN-binding negative transcriptional regulator [Rhodospirillaceae bacterium]
MYVPKPFVETDPAVLHRLIETHDFALLVVSGGPGEAPEAVHLPVVLDPARGPRGTLESHMARANPLWRRFESGGEVLVVFQGAHGYVSPTWYQAPEASVPTWNYEAVHAYGTPRLIEDMEAARAQQARLVARYESAPGGWRMDGTKEGLVDGLLRGIAPFEIEIARLEGVRKLNQNKPPADRRGVVAGLRATGRPGDAALADLMEEATDL